MKTFLIVSCLLAAAAAITPEDLNKYLEAWRDPIIKCGEENGFTDLEPQAIYDKEESGGIGNSTCVHACLLKSVGVLTLSGLDAQKLGELVTSLFADQPELVTKLKLAAVTCLSEVIDIQDECKMAYVYGQCFLNSH